MMGWIIHPLICEVIHHVTHKQTPTNNQKNMQISGYKSTIDEPLVFSSNKRATSTFRGFIN
jgi:hypothetical protein